jgi:hypothetical protein
VIDIPDADSQRTTGFEPYEAEDFDDDSDDGDSDDSEKNCDRADDVYTFVFLYRSRCT